MFLLLRVASLRLAMMMKNFIPKVLTIAGSDPSGGAGIQGDLKTLAAHGVYGMAVITALTAQNTKGVSGVQLVEPEFVRAQLLAIFDDIAVHAVKIGMVGDGAIARVIADILEEFQPPHIVYDPVMVATSGDSLISSDAFEVIKARLIPLADVITPNIPEAEKLLRKSVLDMEVSARDLLSLECGAALLKGGHLAAQSTSDDVLAMDDGVRVYSAARILSSNTHGTGCTLSSAIAANLALGNDLPRAVEKAKLYISGAIKGGESLGVGHGHGPVNHFWK